MSNYTKTVNFATKDNLNSGNPLKIVKGTEIDTEYNNIATAVATKTDNAAAVIVGGTIDGTAIGGTTPAAGAFTTLAASGTTTLAGALVGAVTQAAFNTVSTTLNVGGAATAVNIGAATGTATVANTTLAAKAITASTTLNVTGASTLTGAVTASSTLAVTGAATLSSTLAVTGTSTLTGAVTATAGVTGPITSSSATITGGTITGITDLAVADGGTGASTAANARTNLSAAASGANSDITSITGLTTALTVLQGGTGVTTSTGSGNVVLSTSPTLVTPLLGTPTSGVATNLTGLPISTGVSGLGTGVATLLATPSSANLASAITDETGSGSLVFATSPTLVTPVLGTPTSGTLTNATGLPISTGVSGLGTGIATFLATPSSANLAAALTDETGTGANVFATSPTLVTPLLGTPTSGVATNLTGLPLTTGVTGTLGIANGGTGLTSTPANGALDIGNGTGFTRSTLTAGSNVTITNASGAITIAAAGGSPGGSTTQVQYNNAGAFGGITGATTNGTALTLVAPVLGTPASGTVTNLTGTASININGTVGATTPSTVVATTVQASTTMGVGGATPSASGSGISFPATQSASTDANTLDDYEEGSWTPSNANMSVVGTFSSSGTYVKVGRLVTCFGILSGSTSITMTAGQNYFFGVPFSPLTNYTTGSGCNNGQTQSATLQIGTTRVYSASTLGPDTSLDVTFTYGV